MAGTSFSTVYRRAITEFKDPTLKKLFDNNLIMFNQVMFNFFENAISLFTNPAQVQLKLSDRIDPILYENSFTGDGIQTIFSLVQFPSEELVEDCVFEYLVNSIPASASYDKTSNSVTFSVAPELNSSIVINIYFVGYFNVNLFDNEIYILSQFIISAWSEYIQNDKLDIIRLLGDTDFKLTSVASSTTAKSSWNIVNREVATKRMNKYAWDAKFGGIYK